MNKFTLIILVGMIFLPLFGLHHPGTPEIPLTVTETSHALSLYDEMHLAGKVNREAFVHAVKGYEKITSRKKDILTLIDFSKPSNQVRLHVFDLQKKSLLFSSLVAHGKNSGGLMATHFSNREGSHQSSLGFYLTENTYQGKNGYSLVLEGLETGINDQARQRAIVVHGAAYANPSVIRQGGRLGRSFGCPALPEKNNRPIIDAIKEGSVLYIYAGNPDYFTQTTIL